MHGLRPSAAIRDMEAVFIRALGLSSNQKESAFTKALEWLQIRGDEADLMLSELKPVQLLHDP